MTRVRGYVRRVSGGNVRVRAHSRKSSSEFITIRGVRLRVTRSNREGKKYRVMTPRGVRHFGARGYTIRPGTRRGDAYCARSKGIKTRAWSPNELSRAKWRCKGKKSRR